MPKFYAGIALILLVGVGLWKFWDFAGDHRENQLKAQTLDTRVRAESQIIIERPVYRDRIKIIEKSSDTCVIPADILRVLHDSGIYIGPM